MSVASEVISRVRALHPDSEGRFSDTLLSSYANAADSLVRERTGMSLTTADVTLLPNVIYYGLPSDAIAIKDVLWSTDGTSFDEGILQPITFRDLDDRTRFWKNDTGSRPEWYGILGTPGAPGCYIMVWRPVTVEGQVIRVIYKTTNTSELSGRHIDLSVLPYVMSLIYAQDDEDLFNYWFGKYQQGVETLYDEYASRHGNSMGGPHSVSMSGGNL